MKLISLETENLRNLKRNVLKASENINIFYGDNAQGKTNLIEAIWLCSGAKSFRGAKENELIKFGEEFAKIKVSFEDSERIQRLELSLGEKRKVLINDVPYNNFASLIGRFYCVVFSPSHLSLLKDGPEKRRKFIDIAISQIKPQYITYLSQYNKILVQRNALIKDILKNPFLEETLDLWDQQLAKVGTIISMIRNDYISKLSQVAKKIYYGISGEKEHLEIKYESSIFENSEISDTYSDKLVKFYYDKLKNSYSNDVKAGFTSVGIHRDDIDFTINAVSARNFASQGQQRSCVLSLKLAEANLLKIVTNEDPIILLDDVMSELDVSRQDYILNKIKNFQVFITCCDVSNVLRLAKGKVFEVKEGEVVEIEN